MDSWFTKELEKLGEDKPAPVKSFRARLQEKEVEKQSHRNKMLPSQRQDDAFDDIENDLISYSKNKNFNFFSKKEKKPV